MTKGRVLSGMRPTGRLHIGHLSVLENWVRLQQDYSCFFSVVDWHALTTSYEEPGQVYELVREMVLDWLAVGLDPEESVIFVQSHVKQHAELFLLLAMLAPLSWLERCPTYKDQLQQLGMEGKEISTYGFLGYPLLQAADILIYRADTVPVGEDQLPHLELCREIARRFNFLYKSKLFPEPQAYLARVALLPGIDGRKMSKSYHNDIALDLAGDQLRQRVRMMITDPARIRMHDLGHPEVCVVHTYHTIHQPQEAVDIGERCRQGGIGCVACKDQLALRLADVLSPVSQRRAEWANHPRRVDELLHDGAERARAVAEQTMEQVRQLMGLVP